MRCHGNNREGSGNIPALIRVRDRYQRQQFLDLISTGRRMMPALSLLSESEKNAIASFILEDTPARQQNSYPCQKGRQLFSTALPHRRVTINSLTRKAIPQWWPALGTLNAIDLTTGKIAWKVPLGEYAELKAKGLPATGTENYGARGNHGRGRLYRRFARRKVQSLSQGHGPSLGNNAAGSGFCHPAVYRIGGKQFVVIACGGGKLRTPSGDAYVAFALP